MVQKKRFEFIRFFDLRKFNVEILAFLALFVGFTALYLTFLPGTCQDFNCFAGKLESCSPANFINEESEASWFYSIKGMRSNQCVIEVTLLNAKEGDLDLRRFEGNSMACSYDKGIIAYPEKDLSACQGLLKENIQEVVIGKLYDYIVVNLGEIRDEILFS